MQNGMKIVPDHHAGLGIHGQPTLVDEVTGSLVIPLDEVVPLILYRIAVPDLARITLRCTGTPAHDHGIEVTALEHVRIEGPVHNSRLADDANSLALTHEIADDSF